VVGGIQFMVVRRIVLDRYHERYTFFLYALLLWLLAGRTLYDRRILLGLAHTGLNYLSLITGLLVNSKDSF